MSDADPYGYLGGQGAGQQQPQQGRFPGPQGGYPGSQGGYPGGPQGGYHGFQGGYPGPQNGFQQCPPSGQVQSYYQSNQGYPGGPPSSGQVYQGGPAMGNQAPLPPTQYPAGREHSGWGERPEFNYSQGSSTAPQRSGPQSSASDARAPDGDIPSLRESLHKMWHGNKKDSSDSSDSDSKKKKKDKRKKKKKQDEFNTIPNSNPRDGPYPFSIFCAKDNPEMIVLEMVDGGEGRDLLVGINHNEKHPAYEFLYNDAGDFNMNRFEIPDLNPKKGIDSGGVELRSDPDEPANTKYRFPWVDWSLNVETGWWDSDAGLLQGKSWMKWVLLDMPNSNKKGKFAVRLIDTSTDSLPTVATFYVDQLTPEGMAEGRLEIVARLIRTYEQLDEMVLVAFGAMSYHRTDIQVRME